MTLREIVHRGQASGWKFSTSMGGDLSVGVLSASAGSLIVQPATEPDNGQTISLYYGAIGQGVSALGLDIGGDFSTTSMFSTGLIFTLIGRPLTRADFQGGCVVVSAGITVVAGASAGLFFFGAPLSLTAAAMAAQNASMVGLLPFALPLAVAGAMASSRAENALWRSFKGFAAVTGENRGCATPGVTFLRGAIH